MCFFDSDKDHLNISLSVGGFVSRSKDLLKKLTIIDDKGCSRGGGHILAIIPRLLNMRPSPTKNPGTAHDR